MKPRPEAGLQAAWRSEDGESALYHADLVTVLDTLPDHSVDCIWTDPPYLLSNDGTTCRAGQREQVNKGEWDRSRGVGADHSHNLAWLDACRRVLKPAGTLWVSGTHHVYFSVGMALMELGFRIITDIVWEKPNPPPNLGCRCFTHATELLLWATPAPRGSSDRYTFNYQDMKLLNDGRQMKNVWRFPSPGAGEKTHGKHPTQKPLALIERCLLASTEPDDLVLDPFAGSGSTGVACLRAGRRFIGAEVEAEYAALAGRRLAAADVAADSSSLLSRAP